MNRMMGLATLFATAALALPAVAQTVSSNTASNFSRDRNVAVRERPRSDYEAKGLPLGGFNAFPRLGVDVVRDDNIFATARNETSDTVWKFRPEIALNSDWSRHSLSLFARSTISRYANSSREDTEDYTAGARAQIDVLRRSNISGGYSYSYLTEPRSSPTAPGAAAEPTRYKLNSANLGAVHEMNRLRLIARGALNDYDYNNPARQGGGTIFQKDRNRTTLTESFRAEYAISPDTAIYGAVNFNQRDYDLKPPASTFNRDSSGYEAALGVNFDLSALLRGEVQAGYMSQRYDDPRFDDVDSFAARGNIDWFPTELTTVSFNASTSVEETVSIRSPGFVAKSVGARIDHELLRNVLLGVQASYSRDDYEQLDRQDNTIGAGANATYLMNRNIGVTVGYNYLERTSKGVNANPGFTDNKVSIGLTLQL